MRYTAPNEAEQRGELPGIVLAATFLNSLFSDKKKSQEVNDTNYVVIEKRLNLADVAFFNQNDVRSLAQLTSGQLNNLLNAIKIARLWNLENNIWIDKKGNLLLIDLETRNCNQASEVWLAHPDHNEFVAMFCGFKNLLELTQKIGDESKLKQVIDYIQGLPGNMLDHPYYATDVKPFIEKLQKSNNK